MAHESDTAPERDLSHGGPVRPPLDLAAVEAATAGGDGPARWRIEVLEEVGSTNAELAARHAAGEAPGLVLAAEAQSAGRGRLGREWVTSPRSSLLVSVLLGPPDGTDPTRWAWLPLLTGLAVARALDRVGLPEPATLKWPNDVLLPTSDGAGHQDERKVAGILLERVEHDGSAAAVVGVGLNVHQAPDELPVPTATSLAVAGAATDRSVLLAHLLGELATAYDAWVGGADLREEYVDRCVTVGREVRVALPGGAVEGTVTDVDDDGRLVLRLLDGRVERLSAGDVVHVRPAAGGPVG